MLFYTLLLMLMIRFQPGGLLGANSAARRVLAKLLPGGRS
jgi:branched-chain amino acid transport system permease protein